MEQQNGYRKRTHQKLMWEKLSFCDKILVKIMLVCYNNVKVAFCEPLSHKEGKT